MTALLDWLSRHEVIAAGLIGAIGTILAAVAGVLTWFASSRAEVRKERERRLQREAEAAKEHRDQIATEQRLKQERINDIVRALHAEILAGVILFVRQTEPDKVRRAVGDQRPFATADETDFVFRAVQDDLTILPSEVIHAVVGYYKVSQQTNLLIRDLRDPLFRRQPPEAKREFMTGYLALNFVIEHRGRMALAALADYARSQDINLDIAEQSLRAATAEALEETRFVLNTALAPPRKLHPSDNR